MNRDSATTKEAAAEAMPGREQTDVHSAMLSLLEDLSDSVAELNKFSRAIEHSTNIIIIADRNGVIEHANPILERKSGHSKADLAGRRMREYVFGDLSDKRYEELVAEVLSGKTWRGTVKNKKKTGGYYWCDTVVSPIADERDEITSFLVIQEDTTEKMLAEAHIKHLIVYDELTGLLNRSRFMEVVSEWVSSPKAGGGAGALLVSNIDQFKFFNETYGHATGDYMLKSLANILNDAATEAYGKTASKTGGKPVIGRVGGDEFAVFLPALGGGEAMEIAERLRLAVEGYRFENLDASVTISVGVSVYPEHGTEAAGLMAKADSARFRAKGMGRNRCHLYRPEDEDIEKMRSKLDWREKILSAVKDKRFEPWLQPIMDIRERSVSHYEVLARMIETDGSVIFPGSFVDVAEWFGIITLIDRIIIEKALAHLARSGNVINMSINLSGKEMGDEELLFFLKTKLAETGADPGRVIFEITETAAIANIERAAMFVKSLKTTGCKFALDDFGVGFTSFTYLKKLMVDYIKIDGAFVRRLHENADDQIFVKAIIDVAKGLGIKSIAEFVEYEEALNVLKALGADYAQGYLVGKPAPPRDITNPVQGRLS